MSCIARSIVRSYRRHYVATRKIFKCTRSYHYRSYGPSASASKSLKVTIIGAAGRTGRCLALSLKQSPIIDELAIYDIYPTRGLLLELSHIDSRCKTFYCKDDGPMDNASNKKRLERALRGAKVVAICLEREYLYEEVTYMQTILPSIFAYCPKALVALLSPSVNTLLPMTFEQYKKAGFFEHSRLFGVTNLFSTRANNYAATMLGIAPEFVSVPLIGGGCTRTCIPVFSQTRPCANFTFDEYSKLTSLMQTADKCVAEAYGSTHITNAVSSSFTMGFAAARFCISLCKAVRSEEGVLECSFVRCCLLPELKYMTTPLELGPSGVQKYLGLPKLMKRECTELYGVIPEIQKAIALGESLTLEMKNSTETCPVPPGSTALQLYQEDVTT